ncbi:hypothetical protein EK21DRAFT_94696 [Setomelanomma holmii]|uniref:Uncharacterized protein n=1 Tax=Setomelanomma holmii TaxID=210430 RepID=A0A9P4GXC9_9PLEO|nr:hypothetical protein EK21DRAFT_94696 [Setomelanomma holmii]
MTTFSAASGSSQQPPTIERAACPDEVFRFNDLPPELQLMVFEAHLIVENSITPRAHYVHAKLLLVPLALVSEDFMQNACNTYYKYNKFVAQAAKVSKWAIGGEQTSAPLSCTPDQCLGIGSDIFWSSSRFQCRQTIHWIGCSSLAMIGGI